MLPDDSYKKLLENKLTLEEMNTNILNEANTRFQIIDILFIDVLGWNKNDLEVEYAIGDSDHKVLYIDYLLESNQNHFLVEAKRNGKYFDLPGTSSRIYTTRENGVLLSSKENKKIIEQATKYMHRVGVPFCVLCNGLQFIIIRRRKTHKKDVVVFKSIEDILANFSDFYNILSPRELGSEYLDRILDRSDEVRQPPVYSKKVFDSLIDRNKQISDCAIREVTENYVRKYFSDLTGNRLKVEILKDCYCDPTGKFTSFSKQLKQKIISQEIESLTELKVNERVWTDGNFEKKYLKKLKEGEGGVFILVGGVGAGKTTFINHFYYYELSDIIRKDLIWINIDFLNFTGGINEINDFITAQLKEELKLRISDKFALSKWETKLKIYELEMRQLEEGLPPTFIEDSALLQKEQLEAMKKLESNEKEHIKKRIPVSKRGVASENMFCF